MDNIPAFKRISDFFLTKIIVGLFVVGGSVLLVEVAGRYLFEKVVTNGDLKNALIGITQIAFALLSYILLFTFYEKRQIKELSLPGFGRYALIGFLAGLALQSINVLVIYLAGGYSIISINPVSFLIPSFIFSIIAGFVVEILIRGIIFRLTEKKLGTAIALLITTLIFAIAHSVSEHATLLSVLSVSILAGVLFSAAYVCTRSLWVPIFLHYSWDFAEPGIYGGINPGISVEKSLITSRITGPELLTGGLSGPGNSLQAIIFCSITAFLFLWVAWHKNNFVEPGWRNKTAINK